MIDPIVFPSSRKFIDLTGQRFNRLTVVSFGGRRRNHIVWICRCDCGNERMVYGSNLRGGKSESCGCLNRENVQKSSRKHGRTGTAEYRIWKHIKRRCLVPEDPAFPDYGGRGITMCERWQNSFECFLEDVGECPSREHTIDRRDNDGPYSPENCRWATKTEQARNRRSNILLTFQGRTQCISAWAEEVGLSRLLIRNRIMVLGWSDERAITSPIGPQNGRRKIPAAN